MSFEDDENAVISLLNEDQFETTSCIARTTKLREWNENLGSSFNLRPFICDNHLHPLENIGSSKYEQQYHGISSSKDLHDIDENRISRLYREIHYLKNLCAQQDAVIVDLQKRYKEKDDVILQWKNKAEAHAKTALDSMMELRSKKRNLQNVPSCQCTEFKVLKESFRCASIEKEKMGDIIQSLQKRLEAVETTCQHQMMMLEQYETHSKVQDVPSIMSDRMERSSPPSTSIQTVLIHDLGPLADKRKSKGIGKLKNPLTPLHGKASSKPGMQEYQLQDQDKPSSSLLTDTVPLHDRPEENDSNTTAVELLNEKASSTNKSMKIQALYRRMSAR